MMPEAAFSDPQAMLREMAGNDPRMAMLLQFMQPGFAAPVDTIAPDERDELIAQLSEKLDEAEGRLARVRRVARVLHEAQQETVGRLGRLAAALGACGACWGEDSRCTACRGRGRPGMVRPDPILRAEILGRPTSQTHTNARTQQEENNGGE